jgi:hypothetical protein
VSLRKISKSSDWVTYESVNNENLYKGIEKAFGKKLQPFIA